MIVGVIREFVATQRDAICAATALSLLLYASGVWALETRLVASGLDQPLFVTAPADDSRLFIVEKGGSIKVRQANGTVSTFLDIGGPTGLVNAEWNVGCSAWRSTRTLPSPARQGSACFTSTTSTA